tara:strand:+ start:8972 stop:9184 length:213 start_codon:yes stop_codon:yes gene_type:complete
MQVGDLVQLSARGQKDQWLSQYNGLYGIVIKYYPHSHARGGFRVHWFRTEKHQRIVHHQAISRNSLKSYK